MPRDNRIPRLNQGTGSPPTLTDLSSQQARMQKRRDFLQSQGRDTTRIGNRLQRVGNRMDALRAGGPQTGGGVTYQPEPVAPVAPGPNPLTETPAEGDAGVMPNARMFEPTDYTGSPLYQFQADQGMKRLERLMSARGLTKSGAELQTNSDFLNQLGAQESQRQSEIAMSEADRLERMQNKEADRKQQADDTAFSRWQAVNQMALSQSPMNNAANAAGTGASMTDAYGRRRNAQISGNYRRVGAGGGGGGSAPIYAPPFASGPDFSGSGILDAVGSGSQQSPWLNFLPFLYQQ